MVENFDSVAGNISTFNRTTLEENDPPVSTRLFLTILLKILFAPAAHCFAVRLAAKQQIEREESVQKLCDDGVSTIVYSARCHRTTVLGEM